MSIPFQNNFNGGGAAGNASAYNLNIQPVIPVELDSAWNLILRPSLGYHANVVHPDGGSPWLTRMVVTFMFPK